MIGSLPSASRPGHEGHGEQWRAMAGHHPSPPVHARRWRRAALATVAALSLATLAACSGGDDEAGDGPETTTSTTESTGGPTTSAPLGSGTSPIQDGIRIEVLSSQPDRVTGDDARVRVTPPPGSTADELRLRLGDDDVTGQLDVVDGQLVGVVEGFIEGNNTLVATAGGEEAIQRVRAWPITGPVFSGPQGPLLACSTEDQGLGPATDADCSAPTKVSWRYIDEQGAVQPLADPATAPADLATATIDGEQVPLYVRVEQGVVNRSVYELASIDPTPGDDDPTGAGWNGRLIYRYGGSPSCASQHGQGAPATSAVAASYLEQGYAVATASFNNFDVACNDVLSAETTMMVKERVIEAFGPVDFTIGEGASGGAAQLHLIAQNYPGLVNGIVASSPFPDVVSVQSAAADCLLLERYFASSDGRGLSPAQRTAITGHASAATCGAWADQLGGIFDPTDGCDPAIPAERIYDPATNRGGVRCTIQDASRNQFGDDLESSFAARPIDNVGLQYGYEALNAGTITVEEFLDLNEAVGGLDLDGRPIADRTEADPEAVLRAYETGRVAMGAGDLPNIPIIDLDLYSDPTGDPHDRLRPFSLRDRLVADGAAADAPGYQVWTRPDDSGDLAAALDRARTGGAPAVAAVSVMDEWLTALRASTGAGGLAQALADARPADAVDNCTIEGRSAPVAGQDIYDQPGPCSDAYPISGDPRIAAGGPRSSQVLKCERKPVDLLDYDVELTDAQFDRLNRIFPTGVCDWGVPSVGETMPATPDRTYEDVESPAQSA